MQKYAELYGEGGIKLCHQRSSMPRIFWIKYFWIMLIQFNYLMDNGESTFLLLILQFFLNIFC